MAEPWKPSGVAPLDEGPAGWRPQGVQPIDDAPAPATPRAQRVDRQRFDLERQRVETMRLAAKNLRDAMENEALSQTRVNESERAHAVFNRKQAEADFQRVMSGGQEKVLDETETPIVGSGTKFQQTMNLLETPFVPFRTLARHAAEHLRDPKAGSQGSGADWAQDTWTQLMHPSVRDDAFEAAKKAAAAATPGKVGFGRTAVDWLKAHAGDIFPPGTGRVGGTAPSLEEAKAWQGRSAAGDAAYEAIPPHPYPAGPLGISADAYGLAGTAAEMLPFHPGALALGAGVKGAGKVAGAALKGAGTLLDKTDLGRRTLDALTYGGSLRRARGLAGWEGATDELLRTEVKQDDLRRQIIGSLKPLAAKLSPEELALALDAQEYPGLLKGDPQTLAHLVDQGVDVAPYLTPGATTQAFQQAPWSLRGVMAQAPRAEVAAFADELKRLKAQTWGAKQGVYPGLGTVKGPQVPTIVGGEPAVWEGSQLTHASDAATERALERRGGTLAGLTPEDAEAARRRGQGLATNPELKVRSEYGRELADRINAALKKQQIADAAAGLEYPIQPIDDSRLALNAYVKNRATKEAAATAAAGGKHADPFEYLSRSFFSGLPEIQASKLGRDVTETEALRLLRAWAKRGVDVTGDLGSGILQEKPGAAPFTPIGYEVPDTLAWKLATDGKDIALPRPVAEAVRKSGSLGGAGYTDTLLDLGMGQTGWGTKGYNVLSELFKIPATIQNPAYHVRNWGGNYRKIYKEFGTAGIPGSPGWLGDRGALDAYKSGNLGYLLDGPGGAQTTVGDLAAAMKERGFFEHGISSAKVPIGPSFAQEAKDLNLGSGILPRKALRSLNVFKPSTNPWVQGMGEAAQGTEDAARFHAAARGFKETGDVQGAVKTAEDLLFNPHTTPEALRKAAGVLPFVRWWGKNIPSEARLFTEHPNRYMNLLDRAPMLSRRAFLSDEDRKRIENEPIGRMLEGGSTFATPFKDEIGQPVVARDPFKTEDELFDFLTGPLISAARGLPDLALDQLRNATLSRANPAAQLYAGGTNYDVLRNQPISLELRSPGGETTGYWEESGKAGPWAETIHRAAQDRGYVKPGETIPFLGTSLDPDSPYVYQEQAQKILGEKVPLLGNTFPFTAARLWSQNSTLPPELRVPSFLGLTLSPVPTAQTEWNRMFQTREQLKHQDRESFRKSGALRR